MGVHVGGLDVVPFPGCHCWGAIAAVPVGRVPLLGCMAACHCWNAIAGCDWCVMVGAIGGVP